MTHTNPDPITTHPITTHPAASAEAPVRIELSSARWAEFVALLAERDVECDEQLSELLAADLPDWLDRRG